MKQMLWLSLIPLTAFWLFAVDIYGPSLGLVPALLAVLFGVALSVIGFWETAAIFNKKFLFLLIPLSVSCFVITFPYNVGLILCVSALLISWLAPHFKAIWLGFLFAGIIECIDALFLMIYYIFAPNNHQVEWLSFALSFLSDFTGMSAGSNDGLLFVYAQEKIFPFTVTLEKLGFYPWILIFIGSMMLLFLSSQDKHILLKRIISVILISITYLLLRFLVLIHVFFSSDLPEYAKERTDIFINPWWLLFSFLPLVLLLLRMYPISELSIDFRLHADRRLAIIFTAAFISLFCMTSAAIFQDPGEEKEGRILVDEIHSIWEFSTLKLDKNWYGENSTYNAYSMIEWLNDTYIVHRIVSPSYKYLTVPGATKIMPDMVSQNLTYDILKNYDILIIKTPSHYDSKEVDAIVNFVENGGGLFLIGDHTNFAGTGTNLNQISKRFGITFGYDMVNTIDGKLYYYKRGQLPHFIVRYMPNLDFMTGCSLVASLSSESVIRGFGMGADPGEYASVGFFRETRNNDPTQATDTIWGLINQCVAVKYGNGRVVAFPDSTIISNFRIFFGGSPNLVIGVMEYLNRKNTFENAQLIFFLLGLIAAGLVAYIMGKTDLGDKKMAIFVIILALSSLSVSMALSAFSIETEDSIPSQFYAKNHTISFDGEHSDLIVSQEDEYGQYETFFIWTQRVNLTPLISNSLEEAMAKGRIVAIIDPIKPLSQDVMVRAIDYVNEGNSILLMINSEGSWSFLAKYFGLKTYQIAEPYNTNDISTEGLPIKPWGLAIKGGKSLLTINDRTVLSEVNYGKGKFILFTDSHVFRNGLYGNPGYMGYSSSAPSMVDKKSYDLSSLYNLEYYILEDLLMVKNNSSTTN